MEGRVEERKKERNGGGGGGGSSSNGRFVSGAAPAAAAAVAAGTGNPKHTPEHPPSSSCQPGRSQAPARPSGCHKAGAGLAASSNFLPA